MARRDVVFGDETGTGGDSPFVIVAGYIGSPYQWERFDKHWDEALGDRGPFHAREFFSTARWQSSKSRYHDWKPNGHEARTFLNGLLDVIDWHRILPVGAGVGISDFNEQPLEMRRYVTGGILTTNYDNGRITTAITSSGAPSRPPYMAALTMLMRDAMQHARNETVIDFVLDENSDNEALAEEQLARLHSKSMGPETNASDRIGTLTFAKDDHHPGLQAADLYCYVWNAMLTGKATTELLRIAYESLHRKRADLPGLYGDAYERIRKRAGERVMRRVRQAEGEL